MTTQDAAPEFDWDSLGDTLEDVQDQLEAIDATLHEKAAGWEAQDETKVLAWIDEQEATVREIHNARLATMGADLKSNLLTGGQKASIQYALDEERERFRDILAELAEIRRAVVMRAG